VVLLPRALKAAMLRGLVRPGLAYHRNGNWKTAGICQRPEGVGGVDEYAV
jgi:hypothetical protein